MPKPLSPRLANFDYSSPRTYFATKVTAHRTPIFSNPEAARLMRDTILTYRDRGWFFIFAYCIMPDHIHLLLRLTNNDRDLSTVIRTICDRFTKAARAGSIVVKWQSGYHDHIVRGYEDLGDFAKYVLMNPVRAGLVADWRDYEFSGVPDPPR